MPIAPPVPQPPPRAPLGLPRPAWLLDDRLMQLVAGVLAVEVAGFLAGALLLPPSGLPARILVDLVYMVPEAIAVGVLIAAGRASRRLPCFWYALAAATLAALVGDAFWAFYDLRLQESPVPSPSDAFFVLSAALMMVAAVAGFTLVRPRWRDLIDFLVPFAAILFAVFEYVVEPQLKGGLDGATAASVLECMVTVLAALLFTAYLGGARNVSAGIYLIYASFVVQAAAYPVYAYTVSVRGWHGSNWVYTCWQLAYGLLILAALERLRRGERPGRPVAVERDVRVWLITAGLVLVLAVVALRSHGGRLDRHAPYVALAAIAVVLLRLHQTVHARGRLAAELRGALAEQARLATTDALTAVGNRRAFDALLEQTMAAAQANGGSLGLLIVDLDHFKRVNDGYGHPAGDETLRQAAARLRAGLRPGDTIARIGGEEFGLIVRATADDLAGLAERCRRLISDAPFEVDGQAIRLTASVGGAAWPDDAETPEALAQVSDRALYEAKRRGRDRVHLGSRGVQVRALPMPNTSVLSFLEEMADHLDREQSEDEHSVAMLELAARLCDALHLPPSRRRRCLAAARLHDIGKVGIPTAILTKRGPLSEHEWEVMRGHVRIGVDLLDRCAETRDIAPIVGDHHERPDGRGYPAGKPGEAIPLEARIIAVADAWTAMLANRPYRPALSVGEARAQIVAGRGSQFDEAVVDALVRIVDAEPERLAPTGRAA